MTTAEQTSANASTPGAAPSGPKYTRRQVALAIVALSIGGFAVGVTEFAIMGLQLEAVADLGITIPQAGMLISAYAIGVVVGAPVLSILGAKRERKSYALLLLGVFVLGHVLSFFAPNYETMLIARFLSGLPHGAYFAVAALMAAEMAGPAKRSRAIAVVLGGLAISNVLGVPVVTALGQQFGWRWMFISVIVLALITMAAVARYAPRQMPPAKATMRSEIKGLKNKRLWVGIMLAVVGFSGMFALYSYIAPVSTEVTGFPESALPWVVGLFGAGMVVGNFVGGWAADKSVLGTVVVAMALVAVFMVLFASTAHIPALMLIFLFLVGVSASALGPSMQTHLIDTAPDAPQLAASLHHSAFNAANALGALVGGQVIAAEMGLRAPSYVGAGAAVLGVGVALYAIHLTRKMKAPRTAI
ncbi:MFS transporter [Nesterenkonia sandarakina]|uniref:DHA1 family inner membrane transport protein n=1 Tax=Nesterenkonia sandarakina TaxID=272918 RepID=A0A2T0YGV5_9MICC|nr:MFS transporter [Nesterenkonia sandarakina]PRZ14237.1 DHA1 family inner membrane transport protein [Nesterenkonia sandarakina]